MPRKKKSKPATSAAIELPTAEPQTVAAVLEKSPIAAIIAEHEAKPDPHAEAVASFQRQREREQAVTEPERRVPTSFADAVRASRSAFAPVPEGFVNVDSYPAAGLKVNRSLDRKVAAIQFAEDRPLSRASEYDKMREIQDAGFVYKTARRQWERFDSENPGGNLVDAKRMAADLAKDREGQAR